MLTSATERPVVKFCETSARFGAGKLRVPLQVFLWKFFSCENWPEVSACVARVTPLVLVHHVPFEISLNFYQTPATPLFDV